jgi:hypothetical protein
MSSAVRKVMMAGTSALRSAFAAQPSPPKVFYVVALTSGDLVGICSVTNLARDFEAIKREIPSAKVGYICAVMVDPKMISRLAEGNLAEWAVGGGWFRASVEEAEAAIDAAAKAYTGVTPFHSSSDAVVATTRRRC